MTATSKPTTTKNLIATTLVVPYLMWGGFVLSKAWAWIIVPIFAVRPLSFGECVGLYVVWLFAKLQLMRRGESVKDKDLLTELLSESIVYALLLGYAWFATLLM